MSRLLSAGPAVSMGTQHVSKLARLGPEAGPWRAHEANEFQSVPSGGGLLPVPMRKECVPMNCFVCGQSS